MEDETTFASFPKLYRLTGPVIITEKIDGTNAQIKITANGEFLVGSRTRWITPSNDNAGLAKWAYANKHDLMELLGIGTHFGEWWGKGIQRGYDLKEKRFSLFNTSRWNTPELLSILKTINVEVVPVLHSGPFSTPLFDAVLKALKETGSLAAPLYMNPEGIVIYDTRSGNGYKKTYDFDDTGKNKPRDVDGNVIDTAAQHTRNVLYL